jgi:HEPN domain-containing protein
MPPDPQREADARGWFVKAAQDLRAAEFERAAEPPLAGDIVFHCQQTAEKAMKALLAWYDHPFRKTHNLVELGEQCAAIDPELEPVLRRAAGLTEYAWKFRYPGEPEEPAPEEVEEALALARDVFGAIFDRLPANLRP